MNDKEPTLEDSFRDSIATISKEGNRSWIFPLKPKGEFFSKRVLFTTLYLIAFFTLPFIQWHDEPLFLFNFPEKKFILFGAIFWPQDFFIFMLGMLIIILFVALFTVVYGRLFCGWACPQTVFMEMIFRRIEYWIDGDSNQQKALKKSGWTQDKIQKRVLKVVAFYITSFIICAFIFSYILSINQVWQSINYPKQNVASFITLLIVTSVFFFIYWWFREQVCIIVCPYGRMQSVLLDANSIVVAYDYKRGEERHKFKANETRTQGDCIDCHQCVRVCPTGIDIRNGTQLECINCTACIDACDKIMEGVGLPKNLIRYDSENGIKNKVKFKFTNRMKAYSVVLFALLSLEAVLLVSRSDYDATILRAKGMLYQEQENNQLSNLYTIKLVNKTRKNLPVELKIENIPGAKIEIVGKDLELKSQDISQGEFFVYLNKSSLQNRKTKIEIGIYSMHKKIKTIKTFFLSPFNSSKK